MTLQFSKTDLNILREQLSEEYKKTPTHSLRFALYGITAEQNNRLDLAHYYYGVSQHPLVITRLAPNTLPNNSTVQPSFSTMQSDHRNFSRYDQTTKSDMLHRTPRCEITENFCLLRNELELTQSENNEDNDENLLRPFNSSTSAFDRQSINLPRLRDVVGSQQLTLEAEYEKNTRASRMDLKNICS